MKIIRLKPREQMTTPGKILNDELNRMTYNDIGRKASEETAVGEELPRSEGSSQKRTRKSKYAVISDDMRHKLIDLVQNNKIDIKEVQDNASTH